ncbi:MAG: lipopolysaccharide biosynthesis protein [Candidatus Cloacimonetes bacterium]|nr:lipopolysaccharide biosynthesis protein [Candidatus Cloacimonadota bacterium]
MRTKLFYYFKAVCQFLYPGSLCRKKLHNILQKATKRADYDYILERVSYYNKMASAGYDDSTDEETTTIKDFRWQSKKWFSTYFCDCYEYIRYFCPALKFRYLFGDVNKTLLVPTIVKARPIHIDNSNSVILNLNKYRHFYFIKDTIPFIKKQDKLIFYSALTILPHRIDFMRKFFDNPLCLCRCYKSSDTIPTGWVAPKISIKEHLKYKFVLALEGNDVATCLKWVMSSNCIAVMPKPTNESWFMEGRLIPDFHYIEIKKDYSDLIDKLNYYIKNPKEAEQIIKNANAFVNQFKDKKREKIISLLVIDKLFKEQINIL